MRPFERGDNRSLNIGAPANLTDQDNTQSLILSKDNKALG